MNSAIRFQAFLHLVFDNLPDMI